MFEFALPIISGFRLITGKTLGVTSIRIPQPHAALSPGFSPDSAEEPLGCGRRLLGHAGLARETPFLLQCFRELSGREWLRGDQLVLGRGSGNKAQRCPHKLMFISHLNPAPSTPGWL